MARIMLSTQFGRESTKQRTKEKPRGIKAMASRGGISLNSPDTMN
jgi:hypothetical protein